MNKKELLTNEDVIRKYIEYRSLKLLYSEYNIEYTDLADLPEEHKEARVDYWVNKIEETKAYQTKINAYLKKNKKFGKIHMSVKLPSKSIKKWLILRGDTEYFKDDEIKAIKEQNTISGSKAIKTNETPETAAKTQMKVSVKAKPVTLNDRIKENNLKFRTYLPMAAVDGHWMTAKYKTYSNVPDDALFAVNSEIARIQEHLDRSEAVSIADQMKEPVYEHYLNMKPKSLDEALLIIEQQKEMIDRLNAQLEQITNVKPVNNISVSPTEMPKAPAMPVPPKLV